MTPLISSEFLDAGDYLLWKRCPRSLHWKLIGRQLPDFFPADSKYPVTSDREIVRRLARGLFPEGRDPGGLIDEKSVAAGLPASGSTLFSACCGEEPLLACADIWHPQKPAGMAAVLVREATSIKKPYLTEAAFLLWCFLRCDAEPTKIYLYHLEKEYLREGELDPAELFSVHDITNRTHKTLLKEEPQLEAFAAELREDPTLERYRDRECRKPQVCPLCRTDADVPLKDDLSTLFRGGSLASELRAEGYARIAEVPEQRLKKEAHRVQRRAIVTKEMQVDGEALQKFLSRLRYPCFYLDFEATSSAVPPVVGARPWEHVPYLYSLHTESSPGALPQHEYFCVEPGTDQRREMVQRLLAATGESGSVVVYSAGFERGVLARLGEVFPEYQEALAALAARIVDLLDPFHGFAFYHHRQRGKVSLKTVLPLLTGSDYSEELVQDGYTANLAYRHLWERAAPGGGGVGPAGSSPAVPAPATASPAVVVEQLVSYCTMDTLAMVQIVNRLRQLADGATGQRAP